MIKFYVSSNKRHLQSSNFYETVLKVLKILKQQPWLFVLLRLCDVFLRSCEGKLHLRGMIVVARDNRTHHPIPPRAETSHASFPNLASHKPMLPLVTLAICLPGFAAPIFSHPTVFLWDAPLILSPIAFNMLRVCCGGFSAGGFSSDS